MIDRSEINRLLAKAIAHKQCGNDELAASFARQLVRELECENILMPQVQERSAYIGGHR